MLGYYNNNKMDSGEDEGEYSRFSRERQTTYGLSTEEYSRIGLIIAPLLAQHPLSLESLLRALESNINIRSEPQLIEAIFRSPSLVETLIQFPLQPRKLMKRYLLTQEEAKKAISLVVALLKDNEDFYEAYFLMLEANSQLVELDRAPCSQTALTRTTLDHSVKGLEVWFQFLWEGPEEKAQLAASLGYFAELFLPLVRFYYNESSRICELYEERYGKEEEVGIWLITHFSPALVERVIAYTHHEQVFQGLFTLVRVSLDEQEWQDSLVLLSRLCQSAIRAGCTSDRHVGHLCGMVKEIKDNVSKDRNNTVFAFLQAIIKSRLVDAALNRLEKVEGAKEEEEEVIEMNMQLLDEIVHTYWVLLETGVKKSTQKMQELREELIVIRRRIPFLLRVIRAFPSQQINFSSGESLRRTPLFVLHFLQMLLHFLSYLSKRGEEDRELGLGEALGDILDLVKAVLAQNRWNSILHSLVEQVVGLLVTTEVFKARSPGLSSFLEFLIETFANKKYVFLNSTRVVNQGDLRFLYNLCCKITKSFEGAYKTFGLNNEYEAWESFIVHVLKDYRWKNQKTKLMPESNLFESVDLSESEESQQRRSRFTGYIDEADEMAEIKRSIDKIDTFQKWKNRNSKKTQMHRSGSLLPLSDMRKGTTEPRESGKSPQTVGRNRGSVPLARKMNKSDIYIRNLKKQSSINFSEQQQLFPEQRPMQKVESMVKSNKSGSDVSCESKKRQTSEKLPSSIKTRDEVAKK